MNIPDLIEGYLQIRRNSEALKQDARMFEGLVWSACREKDGCRMAVYEIEDKVEVCIVFADGTSKTYS